MSASVYSTFASEHAGRALAHQVVAAKMTGPKDMLDGSVSTNSTVSESVTEVRTVLAAIYNGTAMDWAHHSKQIVPSAGVFIYARECGEEGTEPGKWVLQGINVYGRVAKKDGTPGEQTAEEEYYLSKSFRSGELEWGTAKPPAWLIADAERLTPGRVAA